MRRRPPTQAEREERRKQRRHRRLVAAMWLDFLDIEARIKAKRGRKPWTDWQGLRRARRTARKGGPA